MKHSLLPYRALNLQCQFLRRLAIPVFLLVSIPLRGVAQETKPLPAADERFKADILLVVAHPDDEGGATPYLARAIFDEHKRVAVVFATRGGSGGNDYSREHGPALSDIREQEARQACAAMGITNVWFLDGKDTASQNVLNSLANWGHGSNLEALVRIVRLTRPEVMISWLPGIFVGENHGDHQAAGVLATEAFDLAGDPVAFPAQVAGASTRLEPYLENLTTWQPKKIYFFSDASDDKQFVGTGPAYSIREISPSQKKPYWRIALDAAKPHLTQFPEEIHRLSKLSDAELEKMMSDPQHAWWSEPMTLIFGKATVPAQPWEAIFPAEEPRQKESSALVRPNQAMRPDEGVGPPIRMTLGGPWHFYEGFRKAHQLTNLPTAHTPEIAVKAGSVMGVPLMIVRKPGAAREAVVNVTAPSGWRVISGAGKFALPDEEKIYLRVELQSPEIAAKDLRGRAADPIVVTGTAGEKSIGEVRLSVSLRSSALPQ
ncbi:MAG TPA: PIG-L family deacetylase [Candidatus Acidoferrum sp.]|nr:PIG-L family deacetylase [Candidatus Acidoferrum sp.]